MRKKALGGKLGHAVQMFHALKVTETGNENGVPKLKKYHSNVYLKTEGEIAWDFMMFCFKKVIKTMFSKILF